jgi:beta-lactam-binding protein with PASTA domain
MKQIYKHLLLIIGVIVALFILTIYGLRFYTKHNVDLIEVPELDGISKTEAIALIKNLGLNYEISDTAFKDGAPKLSVINQVPKAGQMVKAERTIYLVINSNEIPMVEVPDLAGKTSLQQARGILLRRGLSVGQVIERESEYVMSRKDEPVLFQRRHKDTTNIAPGILIERNSKIDLVIGIPKKINIEVEPENDDG